MLVLEGLRKSYGDVVAVDGVSLEVRRGEIFGLLGPNGAGKTTTVQMAVGLLTPDTGRVTLGDQGPPTDPEVRRRLGVAPQSLALWEELTGEENVRLLATLCGLAGPRLRARLDEVFEIVGLASRRTDRASTYSGGMKRRLNLAMALVHDPDLLLLDEPTVGVDPQSRNHILDSLRQLRDRGTTIVYTTHYMEEVERLCDRVAILDHGRVLALGTIPELLAAHGGAPTLVVETAEGGELRRTTDDPLGELGRLAGEGSVLGFALERPDLEQVFLHLTGRQLRDR